jgi:hypothetical protein
MEEVRFIGNTGVGSRFSFIHHQEFGRTTGMGGS